MMMMMPHGEPRSQQVTGTLILLLLCALYQKKITILFLMIVVVVDSVVTSYPSACAWHIPSSPGVLQLKTTFVRTTTTTTTTTNTRISYSSKNNHPSTNRHHTNILSTSVTRFRHHLALEQDGINGESRPFEIPETSNNAAAVVVTATTMNGNITGLVDNYSINGNINGNINGKIQNNSKDPKLETTTEDVKGDIPIFDVVAHYAAMCLYQSHFKKDAIGKNNLRLRASSATNWIDDASAQKLQHIMNQLCINDPNNTNNIKKNNNDVSSNELLQTSIEYMRWFKSIPSPTILDLSNDVRNIVNDTISDNMLQMINEVRNDFLSRIQCRLLLFPSGTILSIPLLEPSASLVFGKLLYGGITRFRIVGTNHRSLQQETSESVDATSTSSISSFATTTTTQRRVGVRTDIQPTTFNDDDIVPTFIMYGGSDRMYESVDMGPAALFEIILYPRGQGKNYQQFSTSSTINNNNNKNTILQLSGITWKPQSMFTYQPSDTLSKNNKEVLSSTVTQLPSGLNRNNVFRDGIRSTVGGLQPQIDIIVRRVLDGRIIRPATDYNDDSSDSSIVTDQHATLQQSTASFEAEELQLLGLTPVRGLLLYGPPGCGKTALAREISKALRARAPKIVSAPELLDRWVGGSEKLVRQLFADAEAELASCNNDATKSALHVIVIDEIDAVFRKRSSSEDTGEATRSSVVNQILAKLDGVNAISNILLIGMTNRRELLDEALLRPGRLEVQIEIPLPNKEGRREILNVHFNALRQRGRLSRSLCNAIDGSGSSGGGDVTDADEISSLPKTPFQNSSIAALRTTRQAIERVIDPIVPVTPNSVMNLATDSISNSVGVATNVISDNMLLATDVFALDAISFPPGAIITDFIRLLRRTVLKRRNGTESSTARHMTKGKEDTVTSSQQPKRQRVRFWLRNRFTPLVRRGTAAHNNYDLASDEVTGGFSGADIAGLVRCAGSLALARARREGYGIDRLLITLEDVKAAVQEVRPKK